MNIFLLTIMNTGTRSVKRYYEDLGHNVTYMHAMPQAFDYISGFDHRVTTIRNPEDVAISWMKGPSPRFQNCNWEEQWALWKQAVTTFHFETIHILEEFEGPLVGQDDRPIIVDPPLNINDKIQFALDMLKSSGVKHPNYGDNK